MERYHRGLHIWKSQGGAAPGRPYPALACRVEDKQSAAGGGAGNVPGGPDGWGSDRLNLRRRFRDRAGKTPGAHRRGVRGRPSLARSTSAATASRISGQSSRRARPFVGAGGTAGPPDMPHDPGLPNPGKNNRSPALTIPTRPVLRVGDLRGPARPAAPDPEAGPGRPLGPAPSTTETRPPLTAAPGQHAARAAWTGQSPASKGTPRDQRRTRRVKRAIGAARQRHPRNRLRVRRRHARAPAIPRRRHSGTAAARWRPGPETGGRTGEAAARAACCLHAALNGGRVSVA